MTVYLYFQSLNSTSQVFHYFRVPVWGPDFKTLGLLPANKEFLPTVHSLGWISHIKSGLMALSLSFPLIAAFLELAYMKPTNLPLCPASLSSTVSQSLLKLRSIEFVMLISSNNQLGRQWKTGRPGMLRSMRSQRVGHDWVTEQQLLTWLTFPKYTVTFDWKS